MPQPDDMQEIRKGFAQLQQMLVQLESQVDTQGKRIAHVEILVNGDPATDSTGIRARLKNVEKVTDEWDNYKLIVKGMAIGVGLTMITSVANLITIITQLAGKVP